jgi:FtsZ-binding cell division protein ZapB
MDMPHCNCGAQGRYQQVVHGHFIWTCGKHGCDRAAKGYTVTDGTMPITQRVAGDRIAQLEQENKELRDQVNEARQAEQEADRERDELKAHCERLKSTLIDCHNAHDTFYIEQPDTCKVIDSTPAQSLAEIKAQAIEEAIEDYRKEYCGQGIESWLSGFASNLRKEAE